MFTSMFKMEVELPKYVKSEVTWGHSCTDVRVVPSRRLSSEELMFLNCVEEDS